MPDFKLPLSGDVTQTINPWTLLFDPIGSQVGLINVNRCTSSEPAAKARNARGTATARDRTWHAMTVQNLAARERIHDRAP